MNEEWRVIASFGEGVFLVSNKGSVKRLKYQHIDNKGRVFKFKETDIKVHYREVKGRGYGYVTLHYRGTKRQAQVHRLVAEAFIPNPDNKPEVNHIDGDKRNNCVENLEWVTRAENMYHAQSTDLLKHHKGSNHFRSRSVIALDYKTGEELAVFRSANLASIFCTGKTTNGGSHILDVCEGRRAYAYGYKWKYCDKETVTTNETDNNRE